MRVMNASGNLIDPFNLQKKDFDPKVIAQTLSRVCRFWGQTKRFYSVAQHCLVMVRIFDGNKELQKWALIHEIFESLMGMDVPTPIKKSPQIAPYREAEYRCLLQAAKIFGLTPPLPEEIKIADKRLMVSEALVLMNSENYDWTQLAEPYGEKVIFQIQEETMLQDMQYVEHRFLKEFERLFRNKGAK
ncbi:hypothetical protein, partial [Helicobacter labetoulli]|uniref:hypothetical protein n=1 Tax=Helicobacter labetoulli TaxID=2315333 RepID=UPI000EF65932